MLGDMVLRDLLGPAGGPEGIAEEVNVHGRYIVGLLARRGQSALPDDDDDSELGHGFHETAQGVRHTTSEPARREALARLRALIHPAFILSDAKQV